MYIVIDVFIREGTKRKAIYALVNSRAEADYIQRHKALELDLTAIPREATPLVILEGKRIFSYIDYKVKLTANNTLGEQRDTKVILTSCEFDIKGVDIILGFLGLRAIGAIVDFAIQEQRYPLDRKKLEILPAKKFYQKTKGEAYIYSTSDKVSVIFQNDPAPYILLRH